MVLSLHVNEKIYKVDTYELTLGVVEDIMSILDMNYLLEVDDEKAKSHIIEKVLIHLEEVTYIFRKLFNVNVLHVTAKEVSDVILNMMKYTIAQLSSNSGEQKIEKQQGGVKSSLSLYEQLFELEMNLCKIIQINLFELRERPLFEIVNMLKRLNKYYDGRQSKRHIIKTGDKTIIRKPASDAWY